MTTIALSSSYGSDGALIGRDVARRLGLEFFDRAIPVAVARRLAIDPQEAMDNDWRAPGRMERVLAALASASMPFFDGGARADPFSNPEMYKDATEIVLRHIADGAGGVILGRAATIVLADRRDVLAVRLDGPVERRITQAIQRRGVDEVAARRDQDETDKARAAYVHTFYGRSLDDMRLYHVVLDSTAVSPEACVDAIVRIAEDRFNRSGID